MKLKAEIMPRDHKYYGTEIRLETEDGREALFVVWVNGISDYKPSTREYDVKKDGKFFNEIDGELWEYEICDNHYETQAALDICNKIVEALNGMEV